MDPLDLLIGLVERYSPTGQESQAVDYLVAQMRTLGFDACVDGAGNAVGTLGDGPAEVVLLGHIDTVPGQIPVRQEGEKLYGRGTVDAKGPLATFVAAVDRVGRVPGKRFVVIGAVGEEGDSPGARFVRDRYRPAALVIGEPSSWDRITLGYKGSAWFEYTVRRTLAHTSAQAESACEAAVSYWNRVSARVAEINAGKPKMFEQLLPTLREMDSATDGFVETARLKFGMRLPLDWSVEAAAAMAGELATGAEVKLLEGCPAYRAEKNTPLVRAFLSGIRAAGGDPGFTLKSGTSDMNIVAPAWGCPVVAYGPGDSALDHTPDEHVLVSEYRQAIEVLAAALRGLDY